MSKNYSALSGAELISGIRKRHRRGVVVCILLIVFCAGLMIGGLYGAIHEKSMFIGIAAVALGGLIAWHSLGEIGRHNKIAAEPVRRRRSLQGSQRKAPNPCFRKRARCSAGRSS